MVEGSPVTDHSEDSPSLPWPWENCVRHDFTLPMIEPLLCGIVLGLIPITLVGLFVAAWNQYRRGSALGG